MRDIHEIARLIRVLEDKDITREIKVQQIKMVRDNGHITPDEAFELAIEYFAWRY